MQVSGFQGIIPEKSGAPSCDTTIGTKSKVLILKGIEVVYSGGIFNFHDLEHRFRLQILFPNMETVSKNFYSLISQIKS